MIRAIIVKYGKYFLGRLGKNKAFCIIPWIHMYVAPDGEISACCMENPRAVRFGNWNKNTLKEAWNSEDLKGLRKDLAANRRRPDVCSRCYMSEKYTGFSHRIEYNWKFRNLKKSVLQDTESNGAMNSMKLHYWDFRFSNLCNLRCRTCGPVYSSSWEKDAQLLGWKHSLKETPKIRSDRFSDVESQIDFVEEIYFAGGEPLLNKEHYQILELLIAKKRTNVRLSYNSNCTHLHFGSTSVISLWKQFQNVYLSPSIDDIGTEAEFLRKGTRWNLLVKNIKTIQQEIPWMDINPTITISVFNVLRIGAIVEALLVEGIINPHKIKFQINMVDHPEHYNVGILTPDLKMTALRNLEDAKIKLTSKYGDFFQSFSMIEESIKQDKAEFRKSFLNITQNIDKVRNEDTFEIYPELKGLRDATRP